MSATEPYISFARADHIDRGHDVREEEEIRVPGTSSMATTSVMGPHATASTSSATTEVHNDTPDVFAIPLSSSWDSPVVTAHANPVTPSLAGDLISTSTRTSSTATTSVMGPQATASTSSEAHIVTPDVFAIPLSSSWDANPVTPSPAGDLISTSTSGAVAAGEITPLQVSTVANNHQANDALAANSSNGTDSSTVPRPDFKAMKDRRKKRTIVAGWTGGVVGTVIGGPVVGLAVGASSAIITKKIGKRNERRKLEKYHRKLAADAPRTGVIS